MDYLSVLCFALACFHVAAGAQTVEITPSRATLLQGNPLRIMCKSSLPLTYCRFTIPGMDGLNLAPNVPAHQGIRYSGNGLDQGDCGVEIMSVNERHNGKIMCSLGYVGSAVEGSGSMRLTVAKAPPAPVLEAQPGKHEGGSFLEGESIRAMCRVENSRPVSNISWFIDDEPITYGLGQVAYYDGPNDLKTVVQNLTHKLRYTDNGKNLKCVASHIAQGSQDINQTLYRLNVRFPPKPRSRELERFGFTIGSPGDIVVQVYANPQPQFEWEVSGERLLDGGMDSTGRLMARNSYKGHGMWDAILSINRVTSEEVDKRYTLTARNELGREEYGVVISTSPAPPPEMTAGAIVGIIIASLLILLLIFMLVFARATGRWCFAGGVAPRQNAESGSGRKKKKVVGPASLAYIDYKLVVNDDGSRMYVSPEEAERIETERRLRSEAHQTPKVVESRVSAGGESFKSVLRSSGEGETVFESVIESSVDEVDERTGKETSVAELALASIPGTPKKLMVADWLDEHAAEGELKLPPPPPVADIPDIEWSEEKEMEPPDEPPPPPPPQFDDEEQEEPEVLSGGSELTPEKRTRKQKKSPSFLERMFGSGKKQKSVSKLDEILDSSKDDGVEGDTESLEAEEKDNKRNKFFGLGSKKRKGKKEKLKKPKEEKKEVKKPEVKRDVTEEVDHELEEPKESKNRRRSSSKKLFDGLFGKKVSKPSKESKNPNEVKAEQQTKGKPEIFVKDSFTVGDEGPSFGYLEVESDGNAEEVVLEEKKVSEGTGDGQEVKKFRLFPVKKSKSSDTIKPKVEKNEKKGLGWSDSELWRPKKKKGKEVERREEIEGTEEPEELGSPQENETRQFKRTFSFPIAWKKKKKEKEEPSLENLSSLPDKEPAGSTEPVTDVERQPGYTDIFFSKNKKMKKNKKKVETKSEEDHEALKEGGATGSYDLQQVEAESSSSEDYYKKKEPNAKKKSDDGAGAFIRNILGMEASDPKLLSARPLPSDKDDETPDKVADKPNYPKDKVKNNKPKKQPDEVLRLIQVFGSQELEEESEGEDLRYSVGDISFSSQDELEVSKNGKKRRRKPFFGAKSKGRKKVSESKCETGGEPIETTLGPEENVKEVDAKLEDERCNPAEMKPKNSEKISLRGIFTPTKQPKRQKPHSNKLKNKPGKDFKSVLGLNDKKPKENDDEMMEHTEVLLEQKEEDNRNKETKVNRLKKSRKVSESSTSGDEQKEKLPTKKPKKKLLALLGLKSGVERQETEEESEKVEGELEENNEDVTPRKKKPKLSLFGSKEAKEKPEKSEEIAKVEPEDEGKDAKEIEKEEKNQTENPRNSLKTFFGSKTKIDTREKKSKLSFFERSKSLESSSSGESTGKGPGASGSYDVQKTKKSFWGFVNDKNVKSDSGLDLERRSSTDSATSSEDSSGHGGGLTIAAPVGKWGPKRKNSPLAQRRTMSGEYCFTGDAPEKAELDAVVLKSFKIFDENGSTIIRGKSEEPPKKRPSSYHEGQGRKTFSLRPLSFGAHLNIASDTESADHGSTDKSSVSKLTQDGVKKNKFAFLDLMKRSKDRVEDSEEGRIIAEAAKDVSSGPVEGGEHVGDRVVYAELDIVRGADASVRRDNDPDKTEYAEIIHPNPPLSKKEELRKSRENLADVTPELTTTPDGKKEAAV